MIRHAVFALLFSTPCLAGTPESILPKTKIIKPVSWYSEQAGLWRAETETHKKDAQAWLNFYSALRYAQTSAEELNQVLEAMKAEVPASFEMKVIQAWHEGFTENAFTLLKEAYRMNPEHAGTYGSLLLFQELYFNTSERKAFSKKLLTNGSVSQALLSYSYNVLMSVEKNAVLFTEGDNTTLPLFILQDVMEVRTDVTILNLDLLTQQSYRNQKLQTSGLSFANNDQFALVSEQKRNLCSALPEQNATRKFYYALTIAKENISSIQDQLYVVGLASQMSKDRLDNISIIKENMENRFLLDYLRVDFNGESEFSAGRVLSSNYLVPMLMLNDYYQKSGERDKSNDIKTLVMKLAKETGKEQLVNNFLQQDGMDIPFFPYEINIKKVDGTLRLVKGNVYAYGHEVTNEEYNAFLNYLAQNNLNEQYEKFKFDLSAYEEPALSFMKNYTAARIPTKKDKFFTNHPAVNISYEAALAYCEWLTEQYNHNPDHKFKKVKFRLPSINEWQIAAASLKNATSWILAENTAEVKVFPEGKMAGKTFTKKTVSMSDDDILYPWFRYYAYRNKPTNSFGCYLGNFKIPDSVKPCQPKKMTTADGFMAMAFVQAYFPNDIGLYDMVGNVAEMTIEKGKACGGSWNHPPEESTIRSINTYTGPDAAVGFRVFMEVIEP